MPKEQQRCSLFCVFGYILLYKVSSCQGLNLPGLVTFKIRYPSEYLRNQSVDYVGITELWGRDGPVDCIFSRHRLTDPPSPCLLFCILWVDILLWLILVPVVKWNSKNVFSMFGYCLFRVLYVLFYFSWFYTASTWWISVGTNYGRSHISFKSKTQHTYLKIYI